MTHDEYLQDKIRLSYELSRDNKFFKKVRAIIIDDNNQVYLLKINGIDDRLYLIGGGVEENESLSTAIKREVAEESGIKCLPLTILGKQFYNLDMEFESTKFTSKRVEYYFLCKFLSRKDNYDMGIDGEFEGNISLQKYDISKLRKTKLSSKIIRKAKEYIVMDRVHNRASKVLPCERQKGVISINYKEADFRVEQIDKMFTVIQNKIDFVTTKLGKEAKDKIEFYFYKTKEQQQSVLQTTNQTPVVFIPPNQVHLILNEQTENLATYYIGEILCRQIFEGKKLTLLRLGLPLCFNNYLLGESDSQNIKTFTFKQYLANRLTNKKYISLPRILTYDKLQSASKNFSENDISQHCASFTNYLIEKYGFEKVLQLFKTNSKGDINLDLKLSVEQMEKDYLSAYCKQIPNNTQHKNNDNNSKTFNNQNQKAKHKQYGKSHFGNNKNKKNKFHFNIANQNKNNQKNKSQSNVIKNNIDGNKN